MHMFRFTTSVLVGPWRPNREEAQRDAIRARQAVPSRQRPDGLEWRVSGRIEQARRNTGARSGRLR
jgi:hypothetical protein